MRKFFSIATCLILLSACAGPAQRNTEAKASTDARLTKAVEALQSRDFTHIFVPAKGAGAEAISEAALKAGAGTSTSRALAEQILSRKDVMQKIVVTGANDQIAALTLIDALSRIRGVNFLSLSIAFVGVTGYEAEMQKVADAAGVKLFYVFYP
jgi:hypothetical protein